MTETLAPDLIDLLEAIADNLVDEDHRREVVAFSLHSTGLA